VADAELNPSNGSVAPSERAAMARARELAVTALGVTSPNPPVGAVILAADGSIAGEGATRPAGQEHAEVVALTAAGPRARGGTAIVTLEPCNHHGRTGPCVDALLAAGIARVVYATHDPTAVAAGGADRLRGAGVDVVGGFGALDAAAGALHWWLGAVGRGRPYVVWKTATTLDGRIAAADGTSRWITSAAARADAQRLRATIDAIVVGSGTVLADDPALTARRSDGTLGERQPLRVVLDRSGRVPGTARALDATAPSVRLTDRGPAEALRRLWERGIRSVLLEGGGTVAGAFLAAGCVDEVLAYLAPKLLGAGTPALAGIGVQTIADAIALDLIDVDRVGADVRLRAAVRPAAGT
jgi:diaminohydroxyphosphoribosylaminopyrimidine deaminase/5-amino-6-(5-phosphoribosylamino)uracil reductase